MKPRVKQALDYFEQGYNCSQAVFGAFSPSLGAPVDVAMKVAGPFGGGMARAGERCGALTGAMMALGLAVSSSVPDAEAKARTYELTERLVHEFKEANGCTDCKGLIEFDLSTEEGREQARQANVHHDICPKLVQSAAEILETLL